jgi:hypothetical protein
MYRMSRKTVGTRTKRILATKPRLLTSISACLYSRPNNVALNLRMSAEPYFIGVLGQIKREPHNPQIQPLQNITLIPETPHTCQNHCCTVAWVQP